jgi:glycosyltransferase involved in cell wall biosynthesis
MILLAKNLNIYINKLNENWIVDRQRQEFISHNKTLTTSLVSRSNLIWIIAPWTWKKINKKFLENRKVICTIHHIDESKFQDEKNEFFERDKFVNLYHATSIKTMEQLKKITNKEILHEPYWINPENWFEIQNKENLRSKFKIDDSVFTIGSFQRDSEGHNPNLPKLSKGPDRLVKIIQHYKEKKDNKILVILSGKRRDFLINELDKLGINYLYKEMVDLKTVNELYNILDLYIVSSRFEGGPQSVLECAITKTPIISTDVGLASSVLSSSSIFDMDNYKIAVPDTDYAYKRVEDFKLIKSMPRYIKMLEYAFES